MTLQGHSALEPVTLNLLCSLEFFPVVSWLQHGKFLAAPGTGSQLHHHFPNPLRYTHAFIPRFSRYLLMCHHVSEAKDLTFLHKWLLYHVLFLNSSSLMPLLQLTPYHPCIHFVYVFLTRM